LRLGSRFGPSVLFGPGLPVSDATARAPPAAPRATQAAARAFCAHLRHVEAHREPAFNDAQLADLALDFRRSSAANIAAGLGKGSIPGIIRPSAPGTPTAIPARLPGESASAGAADGGADGVTAPAVDPGIGIANGFHIAA
jgi:hypothetical protein